MSKLLLFIAFAIFPVLDEVITPAEAEKHEDKMVSLKMEVKSAKFLRDRDLCFLNSEKDHRSVDNFTVVLKRKGIKAFANKDIKDAAEHFKNKTIVVKGKVVKFKGTYQILVESVDQIEIQEEESDDEDDDD